MKVVFLGTGTSTGIPMIGCDCVVCSSNDPRDNRTRTSVYVEWAGTRIVIDTGPDFRAQLLREGIDDIDAVLYTHAHKDHVAGLDDIRPINYLRKKAIDVYASEQTASRLKGEYPYIFEGDYPGVPLIRMQQIDHRPFEVGGQKVVPIQAKHGNMDVLGFRLGRFTYLTDADFIEPDELGKIKGSEVFVINALRRQNHYSHFSLAEALSVIEEAGAKQSYLIHMSHFMGLHEEAERELPPQVGLSYDGLKLELED